MERKVYLSGVRMTAEDKKLHPKLHYYACRHTDNGSLPWRGYTLEPQVFVNHYADVITNFKVYEIALGDPNAKDSMSMITFFNKYQPTEVGSLEELDQ